MIFSEELAKKYVLPNIEMNDHGIFEADFVGRLLLERQRIFAHKRPMQMMEALSIFFSILSMHEKQQPMDGSLPRSHIAGAKLLIENSFGKRLTVREIAAELCIDDRYLYNLFKKYEGLSIKEYIDRRTTENACSLMAAGTLSITRIAHTLGFDDVCTFSKFFKKRMGVSPAAYLRQKE
jgi:AraC-like DNA-binding protein